MRNMLRRLQKLDGFLLRHVADESLKWRRADANRLNCVTSFFKRCLRGFQRDDCVVKSRIEIRGRNIGKYCDRANHGFFRRASGWNKYARDEREQRDAASYRTTTSYRVTKTYRVIFHHANQKYAGIPVMRSPMIRR